VDDICDTGDTIRGLSEVFKNTDFAVLIDKTGDSMVKYRAEYFEADDWVVFPWEQ
jgi:hypoxanthine phosphoribosyltransferase